MLCCRNIDILTRQEDVTNSLCPLQATTLLTMDKYSMQDVQNIHNTCFKLNSLQLHALMTNYHCAPDEPYIPPVRHQNQ